jgi:hypothetical protein
VFFHLKALVPRRAAGIFFALFLAGIVGGNAQTGGVAPRTFPALSLSPVIIAERPEAVQEFTVDPQQVRQMVNRSLLTLTSSSDIGTAWKRLGITPADVVGIKITTTGGPAFCTHKPLVQAICDGLGAAGVPPSQIIIWDKFGSKMTAAGYAPRAASNTLPAIASIVPGNNYDPNVFYRVGILGSLIWGDYQFSQSLNSADDDSAPDLTKSFYTTFLTQTCTKIVNVPVLSYNELYGMDGCMSSLALGSIDNSRRLLGPPTYGDPAIPEVFDQKFIRRKVVVHILDAMVAQCAGGQSFNPIFCLPLGRIYVGRDPVAIDSLALPRLEQARRQNGLTDVGHPSSYITSAAVMSLGTTDRRRIQFLRVP